MFNPTNLDEVCVQATHIEYKGKSFHYVPSAESSQEKGKGKHIATMKKGDTNISCSHCQKYGHDEENC